MDLGGLGNASGGSPGNGGARGIASDAETCNSGIQNGSGASAAPQQAMPAASPQQLPPQAVRTPAAPVAELRAVLRATVTATLLAAAGRGHLLVRAHVLVRVHARRRRRGLRGARPVMSMTVMGPRQRRHGNSRDQNDRRHNAHKLYVHKPHVHKVSAHRCCAQAAASPSHTSITGANRRQTILVDRGRHQSGSIAACLCRPTRPGARSCTAAASVNEIRRRPALSPTTTACRLVGCYPRPLCSVQQRGRSDRARVSLPHDLPSGDIGHSDHHTGVGPSRDAEACALVPALRKRPFHSRERGRCSKCRLE